MTASNRNLAGKQNIQSELSDKSLLGCFPSLEAIQLHVNFSRQTSRLKVTESPNFKLTLKIERGERLKQPC